MTEKEIKRYEKRRMLDNRYEKYVELKEKEKTLKKLSIMLNGKLLSFTVIHSVQTLIVVPLITRQ